MNKEIGVGTPRPINKIISQTHLNNYNYGSKH